MASDAQAYAALVSTSLGAAHGLPSESGANNAFLSNEESLGQNGKLPKTRKPYTITKQRERWSEEEHLRFIEALRLHGRAWRKIEEHIGTKTAVQIRSHAQKFFNKLEKKKEAGEAPDKEEEIAIPPPRPKRKPAQPYPRKDGLSSGYTGTSQMELSPRMQAVQQQFPGSLGAFSLGPAATTQHMGVLGGFDHGSSEVTDATVAAVTAAASAAAAAAAAAVVAAAGQEVQTHMQVHPPTCFPFFGMPPSALAQIAPQGVSALDQAALIAQHVAAKAAGTLRDMGGIASAIDGVVPAARAGDAGMLCENGNGSDRGLLEATGTTDGTYISANAQLRGSDGDSACSRETDNQENPGHAMDASWQSKLLHAALLQHQHNQGNNSPSAAAAARSLAGLQAGAFDASHLQWGMNRCFEDNGLAAAAGLAGLQGLSPAQALAMLSNPLYMATADRQYQHAALGAVVAAAAGMAGAQSAGGGTAAGAASSGDRAGAARTKSRHAAPSVNSGSTGPRTGTKRMLEVGSEECLLQAKKLARESSDTGEEGDGTEVSPSSPSIQEKELKAASQPSNTNGNTSGSNESDGSKRRPGTAQGEGSNPTNGNSSGNGCSVKDSNTATNTGTNGHTNGNGNGYSCGNGTSAFNPVGHHFHHNHQHPSRPNYSSNQQQTGHSMPSHPHGYHYHAGRNGLSNNAGNGASGTGLNTRDEGRSSSDLEGPMQQQTQQQDAPEQQRLQDEDDEMLEDPEGYDCEEELDRGHEQQQDSQQAAQLQAMMASLHGMCGNPMMLQQAYGAAAAAAQQMMATAMQHSQQHQGPSSNGNHSHLAATLQQLQRQGHGAGQAPPVSQGFAPWHSSGVSDFGSSASFIGSSLLQQHIAGQNSGGGGGAHGASSAQLQLQAAAGLMGLASNWGDTAGSAASAGGDGSSGTLYNKHAQLAGQQCHYHHHHHHHHHQQVQQVQQQQQAQQRLAELLPNLGGGAVAAAAAAAGLQHLQQGLGQLAAGGGAGQGGTTSLGDLVNVLHSYPGFEAALTRDVSTETMPNNDGNITAAGKRVSS